MDALKSLSIMYVCPLEIRYSDNKEKMMVLVLQPTCDNDSYKVVRPYLNSVGDELELPDKNNLIRVVLGIISVPEKAKMFNGIEPTVSFKLKAWGVGLYLDNDYVCKNPPAQELDIYVRRRICERMEELKGYKTLRGIKDRTMLDDIAKLFS